MFKLSAVQIFVVLFIHFPQIFCDSHAYENAATVIAKAASPPCKLKPGQTFCEQVENYPVDHILSAISKTPFDIKKFLIDESLDDGPNFGEDKSRKMETSRNIMGIITTKMPRYA